MAKEEGVEWDKEREGIRAEEIESLGRGDVNGTIPPRDTLDIRQHSTGTYLQLCGTPL